MACGIIAIDAFVGNTQPLATAGGLLVRARVLRPGGGLQGLQAAVEKEVMAIEMSRKRALW